MYSVLKKASNFGNWMWRETQQEYKCGEKKEDSRHKKKILRQRERERWRKKGLVGRALVERKVMWRKEESGYEFASDLSPFMPCFLSTVTYVEEVGQWEKRPRHQTPFFSPVFILYFPLLCCFLYLIFFPFCQSSNILGNFRLSVGHACLVSGKSLNALASEILCLHGGNELLVPVRYSVPQTILTCER